MSLPQNLNRSFENDGGQDRLSEMPDEVIVHILSCLPALDAVRTVLLRRFGNLWTLVHTLRFDAQEFFESAPRDKNRTFTVSEYYAYRVDVTETFITFVRNVLLLHNGLSIRKFHLSVDSLQYACANKAADLKIWLRVVLEKRAKEIELYSVSNKNNIFNKVSKLSILPDFKSQCLVKLLLSDFRIEPQLQVSLGSLKILLIHDCSVSDETFKRFISRCPSLQELSIKDPFELKKLSFTAPNINKLSLSVSNVDRAEIPLLLDCPNLKTLNLVIDHRLPKVLDVTSVCHVNVMYFSYCTNDDEFKYEDENDDDEDSNCTNFQKFVGKFEATEVFQLSCRASRGFLDAIQIHDCIQNKWKRVVLELQMFSRNCLSGICHLMSSLEHLEEVIIYTTKDFEVHTNVVPLKHSSSSSSRVMPQLKTITLHSHVESWNHQQRLVECLIKSTPFLDKLVIVPIKN